MKLNHIYCGNALSILKTFPSDSIHCIITSPPYWGLRDYGIKGQLGLEPTLNLYITHLLQITAELKRILCKDGVIFWNHNDCWGGNNSRASFGGRAGFGTPRQGVFNIPVKSKCLSLQNYRLLLRLIDDQDQGWILRNIIIWHKPNHMPSSVKDRFANAYEPIFMLTKSKKYWFDLDAVRVKSNLSEVKWIQNGKFYTRPPNRILKGSKNKNQNKVKFFEQCYCNPKGKNPGDIWVITTHGFKGAHFATFPEKLIEPMIKAGCPKDGTVLDPFCGSGTTCVAAKKLGRNYIGIDFPNRVSSMKGRLDKPAYCRMSKKRISEAIISPSQ